MLDQSEMTREQKFQRNFNKALNKYDNKKKSTGICPFAMPAVQITQRKKSVGLKTFNFEEFMER